MRLSGKNVLLGVTGSISAYKAAELCRLLVKEGANVKVIMTSAAADFISPLTLSTLSKNKVELHMVNQDYFWNNHVELGLWANLFLIAPISANTIAKMANGISDNLLLTVFLSAKCSTMIAPAMDHDMYLHPATQTNLKILASRNTFIIGPEKGELASGLIGEGRLTEPSQILIEVINFFKNTGKLKDKKILVTAGPTREPIDPVRFISNHSSGKMGVSLATAFVNEGAVVTLVAGPIQLTIPSSIKLISVETADEMYQQCIQLFPDADIAVMAAAVADYTPSNPADIKVKKKQDDLNLLMTKTIDILAECGKIKKAHQLLIGFALETDHELENAKDKLERKNLDLIVLNSLKDEGAGFATDTNKITLIDRNNNIKEFPLKNKNDVAIDIVQKIIELSNE